MRVCAKFIPKLLTIEQKKLCFEVTWDNLEMVTTNANMLKKIIIGDDSWIYVCSCYKQNNSFHSEASIQAKAKKSMSKSEQCQVHVDYFL